MGQHDMNGGTPRTLMRGLMDNLQAKERWVRENSQPLCTCHGETLPAAWDEALLEDHQRTMARERELALNNARDRSGDALKRLGVPVDAIRALERPGDTQALRAAKKFLSRPASELRFLVLLGVVGVGKTVGAAFVLREQLAKARVVERPSGYERQRVEPAMFLRASTFARMGAYGAEDRAWFELACSVDALAIDDLGTEAITPIGTALLDELLDRRYSAHLRTVITSNLPLGPKVDPPPNTFLGRIGQRAQDRMDHCVQVAQLTGNSLRKKPGAPSQPAAH